MHDRNSCAYSTTAPAARAVPRFLPAALVSCPPATAEPGHHLVSAAIAFAGSAGSVRGAVDWFDGDRRPIGACAAAMGSCGALDRTGCDPFMADLRLPRTVGGSDEPYP